MGLKYYLNLFKKDSNAEAVKLRYFLNIFVFLVYMVFAAVFFSLRNTDIIVSSVFGLLAMSALIIYHILILNFNKYLERMMSKEILNAEDETDAAFLSYQRGYIAYNEKNRAFSKRYFILNILTVALVTAVFPIIFIVNLMGLTELADKIFYIDTIIMFAYLGVIIVVSLITGKKGVWFQDYINELDIINNYKSSVSDGTDVKFSIVADIKQAKQMEYMLPDERLRMRHKKLQNINAVSSLLFGVMLGLGIVLPSILSSQGYELADFLLPSIFGGGTALWIAIILVASYMQKKIMKEQYRIFKLDEAENSLYIKLHELRIPFMKRWNILFAVCFLGAIISNIIFGSVVAQILKTESYGWIFFLLFWVEFISTYVLYFKAYGRVRRRMMKIEREIETRKVNGCVEIME